MTHQRGRSIPPGREWLGVFMAVVSLALGGCSDPPRHEQTSPVKRPRPARTLTRAPSPKSMPAGQDVAVVATARGLLEVSRDGRVSRVLRPGDVLWCAVDPVGQVVWFAEKTEKGIVVRFLEKDHTVVTVFERWPFPDFESFPIRLKYRAQTVATGPPQVDATIVIALSGEPRIEMIPGILLGFDRAEMMRVASRIRGLRFADRAALRRLVARDRGVAPVRPARGLLSRVKVDTDACEAKELCGHARALPGSGLYAVIVEHSCGDACYVRQVLYDSASGTFVDPLLPGTRSRTLARISGRFVTMEVAPKGRGAIVRNALVDFARGVVLEGIRSGGGWLGGGYRID